MATTLRIKEMIMTVIPDLKILYEKDFGLLSLLESSQQ
ncbi:hypothetical protein MYAER_3864 [Microcystis aeruginosa NIES-2549]|uniref:Uncharacterized protein n=1 Tax=Microcystis aeruginosa NIES-2549 TaxID=1641812 RepID=A0A0F6U7Q7_MICAE|nr:hypothetical protein MYAER_3864 [Microcystis aeruginosa NIES-2549]AOC54604.1 hypothetical protein amyaer_3911 [Microcystis aeruginosa NIES-2481]